MKTPRPEGGSAAEMQQFWQAHAGVLIDNTLSLNKVIFREKLRPLLAGKHLLELGCGSGSLALALAPFCASITGVDFTAPLIEEARRRKAHHPAGERARFFLADIFAGPHLDRQYDIILGCLVIHEIPATHYPALGELLTTHLAAGGFCVFEENSFFNPLYRLVHRSLVGRFGLRKIGSPHETPFDPQRYALLQAHFAHTRRVVWTFSLFRRLYQQTIARQLGARWPALAASCAALAKHSDYAASRTLGDSPCSRTWSLVQVVYLSQSYAYNEIFV